MNCSTHIWCLDHEKYFDGNFDMKAAWPDARIRPTKFPAKCPMCKSERQFSHDEWLQEIVPFYGHID